MSKRILIDRIQVTLEPWRFGSTTDINLRVAVDTMGQRFRTEKLMMTDDITPHFDRMFDEAKEEIRRALKKHADADESAVTI